MREIEAILEPFRREGYEAGCEQMGHLWAVWIGTHGGGREDGISLARELAEKVRGLPKPAAEEAPVPRPEKAYVDEPKHLERIAELEAMLAAASAPRPEPVAAQIPPDDVADLINWQAPPKERQEALLVKLREVIGLIGLAEDRGARADPALYKKRDRIESGIRFNRASSAEAI
jgi:hypothetical protein